MIDELEHRIRERAHRIWEQEGRPAGRAEAHWAMASAELAVRAQPKPAAAPRPAEASVASLASQAGPEAPEGARRRRPERGQPERAASIAARIRRIAASRPTKIASPIEEVADVELAHLRQRGDRADVVEGQAVAGVHLEPEAVGEGRHLGAAARARASRSAASPARPASQ